MNINKSIEIVDIPFLKVEQRDKEYKFSSKDYLFLGIPVYAGRIPNVLLPFIKSIKGNGAKVVFIVMFGNRNYDDALIELYDILRENDFCILGAGAFIGEHSFSYKLAANRPDAKDFEKIKSFAIDLTIKANRKTFKGDIKIKGQRPYRFYYMPKNDKDEIIDIRKVKPLTNDNCIDCKKCAEICPMNSIDKNNVKLINGICIKCGGCIKVCPVSAKYFEDVGYLFHKEELEKKYIKRLEPEYFV